MENGTLKDVPNHQMEGYMDCLGQAGEMSEQVSKKQPFAVFEFF